MRLVKPASPEAILSFQNKYEQPGRFKALRQFRLRTFHPLKFNAMLEGIIKKRDHYTEIAEHLGQGVLIVGKDGKIEYANPKLEEIFGAKREGAIGTNIFDFLGEFLPEGQQAILKAQLVSRSEGKEGQYELTLNINGVEKIVFITARPRFNGGNTACGSIAVVEDITVRKKAEAETILIKNALAETVERLGLLFRIIRHEIGGPLGTVIGYAEILREELPSSISKENDGYLLAIITCARNILDIVNEIRDMFSSNGKPVPRTFIVSDNVLDIIVANKPAVEKKNAVISHSISKGVSAYADPNVFDFVLRNLIANGVKFCPKENGSITVSLEEGEQSVIVSVSDNGAGIPPSRANGIFVLGKTTPGTANEQGTGLGLANCRTRVLDSGGEIWYETKGIENGTPFHYAVRDGVVSELVPDDHSGTAFFFTLPKEPSANGKT